MKRRTIITATTLSIAGCTQQLNTPSSPTNNPQTAYTLTQTTLNNQTLLKLTITSQKPETLLLIDLYNTTTQQWNGIAIQKETHKHSPWAGTILNKPNTKDHTTYITKQQSNTNTYGFSTGDTIRLKNVNINSNKDNIIEEYTIQ